MWGAAPRNSRNPVLLGVLAAIDFRCRDAAVEPCTDIFNQEGVPK